jgi:hypothetical protein
MSWQGHTYGIRCDGKGSDQMAPDTGSGGAHERFQSPFVVGTGMGVGAHVIPQGSRSRNGALMGVGELFHAQLSAVVLRRPPDGG